MNPYVEMRLIELSMKQREATYAPQWRYGAPQAPRRSLRSSWIAITGAIQQTVSGRQAKSACPCAVC